MTAYEAGWISFGQSQPLDLTWLVRPGTHAIYGEYGLSVFAVRDATVDELAQQVPLVRFDTLTLLRVEELRAGGFGLEATGRNPRHFTVVFDRLDPGVAALVSCEHVSWVNPYYEP